MSLTIVIPCMNEEKYIGTLLDQLASQIGIQSIPIIIADGGSQDSTLDIINQKKDNYSYLWNWVHRILTKRYPFAIGGFFMTKTVRFRNLGGFDERVDNSGDFLASQWYSPESFFILDRYIGQDNRRVKKIGYRRMIVHLIKNFWMYRKMGKSWFYKKSGYWG